MHIIRHVSKTRSDRFPEYTELVWKALLEELPSLPIAIPDGIGDIPTPSGPLSFAHDPAERFMAIRVLVGRNYWLETFFLSPANRAPRIGIKIESFDANPPTPAWASSFIAEAADDQSPFPGFLELVAILASKGNLNTVSSEMAGTVSTLTSERDTLLELVDSQADALRQVKNDYRDLKRITFRPAPTTSPAEAVTEAAPTDLVDLPDWAAKNSDRIVILPRALNSAKKSRYDSPATIFAALELLAGPYREQRMGILSADEYAVAMGLVGVQLEGSIKPEHAGNQGDSYFVTYKNRREFLNLHILKGGGRDERYCMRIYFFWDDDSQRAVVGWLPSHLNNSYT